MYTFDSGVEGFRINYVCLGTGNCVAIPAETGAGAADAGADGGDAAAPPAEGPPDNGLATATFDAAVGSPSPGSVKVDINFTAIDQLAVLALNIDSTNLASKVISAQLTIEAGAPATVGGKMYVKTGETYSYADSGQLTLTPGTWSTLTYASPTFLADATVYDVTDVREIGIEFAIPMATTFSPAVIHVDTVQY